MTYTIEIIRKIGDHVSAITTEVDKEMASMLMYADIIKVKQYRIKVETRELIISQQKIVFTGDEYYEPK
ncbi:hypothetical protein H1Z61_02180 [Bacillus aquiflavi]|uniref:Uncharacterized protein n=1 Tax=Bacillus aquiflavi TaxID=2672567 RepID=A0A6B3VQV7_9BACI|nr:hypothetical protein [Bacillus aquiflavi]MBA4535974.1 hypothetical protein [Bacillus aquiflavi]NEY80349.1 hypothetical protein [Bacillus aquiflavi]UAC49790.1 hypothetical protein K6959_08410 [Bacillus aquiflavi]